MPKHLSAYVWILSMLPACVLADVASTPAPNPVLALDAQAAQCVMVNVQADVSLPREPTPQQVSQSLTKSRSCVRDALPRGKEIYRQALLRDPAAKPHLSHIYARWLDYMHSLEAGFGANGQDAAKARFREAISDMQADVDASAP